MAALPGIGSPYENNPTYGGFETVSSAIKDFNADILQETKFARHANDLSRAPTVISAG